MIKIYQGKSRSKKQNIRLGLRASRPCRLESRNRRKIEVVASGPVIAAERLQKGHSLSTFGGAGTKPVARPEIMYKDNPEMLERELKARERHRDKCKEK